MATVGYIRYRADYKYQLANDYSIKISIKPKSNIDTDFIGMDVQGNLLVKKGYAWDGPSGPVIDTDENMRASLVHDALYQLMRNEHLAARTHRKAADQLFKDICKEDGVSNFRASAYYKALRKFGKPAASPQNKKIIHRAPKA
jgi:NAD-dependent oxidoreductase involved in siderophore biosynthesis